MTIKTDVDIDFADRDAALRGLHHVPAMMTNKNGQISRHASGVYFHNAPTNPLMGGLSAFDYKESEDRGYFKVDFLNQSVYLSVRDEDHLNDLIAREAPWELLDDESFVEMLPHIGNHFDIVSQMKPTSVEELAEVLAILRPAKRYLLGSSKARIKREIWKTVESEDGIYMFKKAHAIAYAMLVVIQMNLIIEDLMVDDGISI